MTLAWGRDGPREFGTAHWVDTVVHDRNRYETKCEFTFLDLDSKIVAIMSECEAEGRCVELIDIYRLIGTILGEGGEA